MQLKKQVRICIMDDYHKISILFKLPTQKLIDKEFKLDVSIKAHFSPV